MVALDGYRLEFVSLDYCDFLGQVGVFVEQVMNALAVW